MVITLNHVFFTKAHTRVTARGTRKRQLYHIKCHLAGQRENSERAPQKATCSDEWNTQVVVSGQTRRGPVIGYYVIVFILLFYLFVWIY